jgi:hypothetical protein
MANAKGANVQFVDTNDTTLTGPQVIVGIKYIGNTSGTATIKQDTSGGAALWEESGSANTFNQVYIKTSGSIHVALTNSAKVYIYYK